jgi:hypothetical protein
MVLAWLVAATQTTPAAEPKITDRWVYLQKNLQVTEEIPKVVALIERAAAAGYNGVVLADYKLNILGQVPDHYFRNIAKVKAAAERLNVELIPCVASFGYSDGILAHDVNLAEGLPVKDAPFVVKDGVAVPESTLAGRNLIPGDFEEVRGDTGDTFAGWGFQDEPGAGTYVDRRIRHRGRSSLRIEKKQGVEGNLRVSKELAVRPWTPFHASVWIRTEGFENAGAVRMFAMSPEGRVLSHSHLGVKRDQDWTRHHVMFNSLGNEKIRFYLGVWGAQPGKMWIDDAAVTESHFVNLVRRDECPLVVADARTGKPFEEGRDFERLVDPKLGRVQWAGTFDVYHEPPVLKLTSKSRIKPGTKLKVSYFHAVTIYDNQTSASLTDPKSLAIVGDQIDRVHKLLNPKTWFLSHDEIRVANWSIPAGRTEPYPTAGEVLADNVRQCVKRIRDVNPDARICIWSDMFDPHHNAVDNYYLVNGSLAGSWEGVPSDVTIINWNGGKPRESLSFFAGRKHQQVLAGYYDSAPGQIRDWLEAGEGLTGVNGVMYTTWQANFNDLEAFAAAAWGGSE